MNRFAFFIVFLLLINGLLGANYYRENGQNEIWDSEEEDERRSSEKAQSSTEEDEEAGSIEQQNEFPRKVSPGKIFKRFVQLKEPSESWPTDFYRSVSICVEQTPNGTRMFIKEFEQSCPSGKIVALGRYRAAVNETGWGILEVETFAGHSSEWQSYAAGLAEGSLTKLQISNHYSNTVKGICRDNKGYCRKLYRYLNANLEWISAQIDANRGDLYWRQVNLTFNQLTGIFDGYAMDSGKSFSPRVNFTITPIYMIQLSGELIDLSILFKKVPRSKGEAVELAEAGHCSGLVKVTEGNSDLLMSQVAMSGFNTMNRIVKLYKFAYDPKDVPGFAVSFSGYPAALASADDFTLTSAGLLSIETTISVFDKSLYSQFVHPQGQLHCWLRSYISNQLTSTAHDWVKIFARFNSGTYNNQWTVVDYKLFKPGQQLPQSNLIWVLEQIPGTTVSRDVTWFLRKYSYWPSYNIPFLRRISELSGFDRKGEENDWWKWGFCPRARIFHRDHQKVRDIEGLRDLMRYNNYKHEEFSRCVCSPPYTAEASISTRGDLNPANGTYQLPGMGHRNHGALDYKGTNFELFKQLRLEVFGGPTYGGPGKLPPFNWETTDIEAPHEGQPKVWQFEPFVTQWVTKVKAEGMEEEEETDE
ncbi:hypothetical protein niasHT_022621 [Heterodera trifolii]|uniref:Phospholipase B-like n=1 Tax=Heterodera trifolii TaxID=157864 RepID=A0ABD2JRC8_9BILA